MKQLVTFFGWVPVLGTTLKISYLTKCANDVFNQVSLPEDTAISNAADMEKVLHDLAENIYDEHLSSEVSNIGLPDFLGNKIRAKLVDIVTTKLKSKYIHHTTL
jgi:hypothetical protein